jgi:hypothetical protein
MVWLIENVVNWQINNNENLMKQVFNLDGVFLFPYHCFCIASFGLNKKKHIGGVMASVLASSAVDRGFDPRSGQTNHYKIGICCSSPKHAALRRKNKDWIAGNQDNVSECPTRPSADYCFSKLALYKSNYACWSSTK